MFDEKKIEFNACFRNTPEFHQENTDKVIVLSLAEFTNIFAEKTVINLAHLSI